MELLERLELLMQHLHLQAACFATQIPHEIAALAAHRSERIVGLVLCAPTRLDAAPFGRVGSRTLLIAGEFGLSAEATARAKMRLAGAQRHILRGYDAAGWSDVVADRTHEIATTMIAFLTGQQAEFSRTHGAENPRLAPGSGRCAGLTYMIRGQGPALILLPLFLAPSQWEPALVELAHHFTVISVGGPHIGAVAALEDRARAPSYRSMFNGMLELMAPRPGSAILDVGCGSGALDRLLARRPGVQRIDAVDRNGFLLREAAALAADCGAPITFTQASALALPFAEETFECVFSVTMLEECDADRAIAEMVRVARPGARLGLAVRAIDLPQWWSLALPAEVRAKAEVPPQSVDAGGVADASLYARMLRAGLSVTALPALITLDRPGGPIWRYREDHVLSQLSPAEAALWNAEREAAAQRGVLIHAHALHCAVGTKPGRVASPYP